MRICFPHTKSHDYFIEPAALCLPVRHFHRISAREIAISLSLLSLCLLQYLLNQIKISPRIGIDIFCIGALHCATVWRKFRGHNHNVPPLPQFLPDLGNNLGQGRVLLGVAKCAAGLHKYFLSNAANCISTSCNTLQSFSLYADKSFHI